MTALAYIALYGWAFVVVPVLFLTIRPRLAVFISVTFGWLYLPFARVDLPGPLELNKFGACTLTVLLCAAFFDLGRFLRFRPLLLDIPMLLWLTSPPLSSLMNGLGTDDAISEGFRHATTWGLPYLLGRLYVTDAASLRQMALVFVFAGVSYVPLVLWEARMSPRLHADLYGLVTFSHGGFTTRRLGGWRPVVFQQHGLMLGLLMASAAVVAGWMWFTGSWRKFSLFAPFESWKPAGPASGGNAESWRSWSGIARRTGAGAGGSGMFPVWPIAFGLVLVAVLCRALNAFVLMAVVAGALLMLRNPVWATRLGLLAILLMPPVYFANRISPDVIGVSLEGPIMELARAVDPERAVSLQVRFDNEYMLSSHAMSQPIFGWGGWGRNRIFDEWGNDISITDGYWIIVLGKHGLYGLLTWYTALVLPIAMMLWRYSAKTLASKEAAPAVALAMVVLMFAIDCVPNAMITVLHPLAVGGLASIVVSMRRRGSASGVGGSAASGSSSVRGDGAGASLSGGAAPAAISGRGV